MLTNTSKRRSSVMADESKSVIIPCRVTRRARAMVRACCEMVESRVLLSVALRNAVPTSIAPTAAQQELLAPGLNSYTQSSPYNTVVSTSYRFVLTNADASQVTTFQTTGTGTTDALIAIYDASGNRIALQDADPASTPGNETLTAALQSGVPYTVAFYSLQQNASAGTTTLAMSIDPGAQALGSTLRLSPPTNTASLNTSAAPNAFAGSASVRYFPLDLLNAGVQANLNLSPGGPDSAVAMSVFLQTGPNTWVEQSTRNIAAGQSIDQSISPPVGQNVTDGNYLVALAPLNFTAAAQPMNLTASTVSALVPATVSPGSAEPLPTPSLNASGTLTSNVSSNLSSGAKLFSLNASVTGPMTISYTPGNTIAGRLAVYGPGGMTLLDVASRTTNGAVVPFTFEATAGTQYFIYAGSNSGSSSSSIGVSVTQSITPTPVSVSSVLAQQANLAIAPSSGARAFTLTSQPGARFVALQLAPDAGSTLTTQLSISGASGSVQTLTASGAGQAVTTVVDTLVNPGPYQVLVRGTAGTGTASFKYVSLAIPQTVNPATLNTTTVNLQTGGVSSGTLATTTGQPAGVRYFLPHNGANPSATTYTATPVNGAAAVLLHYVEEASAFRLVDIAMPNASGVSTASSVARGHAQHAIVALPVNFNGSGTVALTASGPLPTGLGLSMVPNALPNTPPPTGGYNSIASVNGAKLQSDNQRDLYATQVPFNLSGTTSSLVFTPAVTGGSMRATVAVMNASNVVLGSATSLAGQPVTIPINSLTAGQTLRFEVRGFSGVSPGNNEYGLSMTINTTNPLPFLVTQSEFFPYTSSQVAGRSYLPNNVQITNINFGTSGGSATGNFTSSTPYNNNGTGSIHVYAISGFTNNNPYQISTTAIDPSVNTNFAIFYFDTASNSYKRMPGTAPSFDYHPADRSTVDARIIVNNTNVAPSFINGEFGGSRTIYVVVMNEQGTRGQYQVRAEPAPVNVTGPGNATPANVLQAAPQSGAQNLPSLQAVQTTNGTAFTLRTPADMSSSGTPVLTVRTRDFSVGQTISVSVTRGIIFVGTATGTVGAGGVANIQMLGETGGGGPLFNLLGPGTTYAVTVNASSFPSAGLTLNLTVPYTTLPGTTPPATLTSAIPLDANYTASIVRMQPAPNGAISESVTSSSGLFSRLFYMPKAGTVNFTINSASSGSPVVGLYQAGKTPTSPHGDISVRLDFDNTRTNNNFVIAAALPAGVYWLRGQGFDNVSPITITGTIPAFQSKQLEVQPGLGITTQAEQAIINQYATGSTTGTTTNGFTTSRYTTSFFKFVVPSNASGGPVTFTLDDYSVHGHSLTPAAPVGRASLSMWRFANGVYTRVATQANAVSPSVHSFTISAGEAAVPGAEYFVGVDFNAFQYAAYVGFEVPVFQSGVADFSVQPIALRPNNGQTLVGGAITNASFTSSQVSSYALQLGGTHSTRTIPALAPFGQLVISLPWTPIATTDVVSINANPSAGVAELSRANNQQSVALSSVNSTMPSATIQLLDTNMTTEGNAGPSQGGGTWGRYIAGVTGQTSTIRVTGTDAGGDLYQIRALLKTGSEQRFAIDSAIIFSSTTTSSVLNIPFDFGTLAGTNASSPNQLQFYAIDQYGLRTPVLFQTMNVAAVPSFLSGGIPEPGISGAGGTITFNRSTRLFQMTFQNNIISMDPTLSQLLAFDMPFIGDKKTELFVSIKGTGAASLSPLADIALNLVGSVKLSVLDYKLYDKTLPNGIATPGVTFAGQMRLDARTLAPAPSASAVMQIRDLKIADVKTPLIRLFSFGAPGIAELKAGVKFTFNAELDAAAKIGFNPGDPSSGYFGGFGVMSPTFIRPSVTASATVSGEAELLGFDIAEVSGSLGMNLAITFGLDNNVPGRVFTFPDAALNLGFAVEASFTFSVKAEVLGFDVYEYKKTFSFDGLLNSLDQGIFLTDPPSTASGKFVPPSGSGRIGGGDGGEDFIIRNGNSLVGEFTVDPHPQIAIHNAILNGMAHSVQVVNVGTTTAPMGNLAVTRRNSGAWASLSTLSQNNDVNSPELAMTNDGATGAAVVVYAVDKATGSPSTRTINQKLTNQELRYRYFNGTTWSAEQTLTNDSLLDQQHSLAFNATGAGVLAFVTNSSTTPVNGSGQFSAATNDIRASIWNPTTHTWSAPVNITTGNGSDSLPTTFVDASGKHYIVWVNTSTTGVSQLMYSTSTGGSWTAPAVLNVGGLAPGGTFRGLAMGSDAAGRVNVIFSHYLKNADGSLSTTLYQRPATTTTFASTQPAVMLAENATYSGLRATAAPNGSMVVYWQQSDGQANAIVGLTISNGVATAPIEFSNSDNVERAPTAAVDGDGSIELLYNDSISFGSEPGISERQPRSTPAAGGVVSLAIDALPQPAFVKELAFVESASTAPTGTILAGTAVLTNSGMVTSSMTITAYSGQPGAGGTVVGTQTIALAPGATYNYTQNFIVAAGTRDYVLVVTTPGPQALGTTQIVSTSSLTGLTDLVAVSLTNVTAVPGPGGTMTVRATLRNGSNAATPSFAVSLFSGDPRSGQFPSSQITSQTVSPLAANETRTVDFTITLPSGAGEHVYTVAVDPNDLLLESDESNNYANYVVSFRADPSLITPAGIPGISAALINAGTSNNVNVEVIVTNSNLGAGSVPLVNVPVHLRVSRNGGVFESLGQMIVPSLAVGASTTLNFLVTARAGENVFVASIDTTTFSQDVNLLNNSATTSLTVSGIAALAATGSLNVSTIVPGNTVTLNATLSNTGLADANGVVYTVLATSLLSGVSQVVGGGVVNLAGLSSQNLALALSTSSLPRGLYTIRLILDPNEAILEDSRAGNELSLSLMVAAPLVLTGTAHYIRLSPNGNAIDIWNSDSPTGSPDASYPPITVPTLSASGTASGQRITVDFSFGNPLPSAFSFIGNASAQNRLTIVGTSGADNFALQGNQVNFTNTSSNAVMTRSNVGELAFVGSSGVDVIGLNYASGNPLPSRMKLDGTFTMNGLQSFANTTFDLFQSTLRIAYAPGNSPAATIRQALARGFNGGAWNGTATASAGAFNSSAAPAGSHRTIGYADFGDGTGVNTVANTILLKFTQRADINLDAAADFSDLLTLAQNYGQSPRVWTHGDLNYDGVVDFSDLLILAQEYNSTLIAAAFVEAAKSEKGQAQRRTPDVLGALSRLPQEASAWFMVSDDEMRPTTSASSRRPGVDSEKLITID